MESAICLRYCPFPYGSKGLQAARPSRFHLKFKHATPFYVPQFSTTTHSVTRSIKHANCMLERFSVPSENERKSGNKILRGVTAVSLVLACVLGLFNFRGKMNPKFNTAYAMTWSSNKKVEADGKSTKASPDLSMFKGYGSLALKLLLEIMSNQQTSTYTKQRPSTRPPEPDRVKNLTLLAIHENKSKDGKNTNALKELKYYSEQYEDDAQTIQYVEVALVEVFMFTGEYEEALKQLDQQIDKLTQEDEQTDGLIQNDKDKKPKWFKLLECYHDPQMAMGDSKLFIAKRILYKAILHTVLSNKQPKQAKEARVWWQAFIHVLADSP